MYAQYSIEVARALLFLHRSGGLSWCMSSSQSWSVGLVTQEEDMDAAQSMPLPCECHLLTPLNGREEGTKGLVVLRNRPTPESRIPQ